MIKKAIVMIGHSHLVALVQALAQRARCDAEGDQIHYYVHDVWPNKTNYAEPDAKGGVIFNPDVLASIDDIVPADCERCYVTLLGGNGHVVLALAKHPRSFDFFLPDRPDLSIEPDAEIIPYGYISKVLLPIMYPYVWQLIAFRQSIGRRCLCVETPPPCGDDEYLRTHLGSYISNPNNIAPRDLRLKMWRLHSRLLQEVCTSNDIALMQAPKEACDQEGFLRRECYGADATHGNAWYGEMVLRHLENMVRGRYHGWTQFR